jgi:hypothetical protein
VAFLPPKVSIRAIINVELKIIFMSVVSCSSCVVVLNQQQEENISHQQQFQDESVTHNNSAGKNCTVVENGRVVVVPAPAKDQSDVSAV